MSYTIGVDISKADLDVHRLGTGQHARFGNDQPRCCAFADWIGNSLPDMVIFGPTGPYYGKFERHFMTQLPLAKVNPLRSRRFAQACGGGAKIDAVDVRMLAMMQSLWGVGYVLNESTHADQLEVA
jgi:transposase